MKVERQPRNTVEQTPVQEMTPDQMIAQYEANKNKIGEKLDKSLLPSRGVFYPDDLYITPFTGKDLIALTKVNSENLNPTLYKMLAEHVTGIEYTKILSNDKLWLIYYIRDLTYRNQPPLKLKVTCPSCGAQTIYEYKLEDLLIDYYDNQFPEEPIELPNGDKIELEFPTIGTEIAINRIKTDPNNYVVIDDDFMLIASYLKSINGKPVSLYDAYEYASTFDALSFCKLISILDTYTCGCRRVASVECGCGEKHFELIQFTQQFFVPKVIV